MMRLAIAPSRSEMAGRVRVPNTTDTGMSPLLGELTRNGTVVPTAEEALEMRFMPFEEYCLQTMQVQFGVSPPVIPQGSRTFGCNPYSLSIFYLYPGLWQLCRRPVKRIERFTTSSLLPTPPRQAQGLTKNL
ncbi:hypothetical protein NHQ30_009078 [Ciborinia camelliae]|nr:hypothetical protein NHQ30_009078 [Ciborinia camelliae]